MHLYEAIVNGIANDFEHADIFDLVERGFILEKEIRFTKGSFELSNSLKMSRLTERIELIFVKFDNSQLNKDSGWWSLLVRGLKQRNELVHPKQHNKLEEQEVGNTLNAVIACIDALFKAVYKKNLPSSNMGLISKLTF